MLGITKGTQLVQHTGRYTRTCLLLSYFFVLSVMTARYGLYMQRTAKNNTFPINCYV